MRTIRGVTRSLDYTLSTLNPRVPCADKSFSRYSMEPKKGPIETTVLFTLGN